MTTLTLEIPDELASRLVPLQKELPHLLLYALDMLGQPGKESSARAVVSPLHTELLDFLASGPSHTEIASFKFSVHLQKRLEALLETNREENLTASEQAELDVFQQMNHLLILLKARVPSTTTSAS